MPEYINNVYVYIYIGRLCALAVINAIQFISNCQRYNLQVISKSNNLFARKQLFNFVHSDIRKQSFGDLNDFYLLQRPILHHVRNSLYKIEIVYHKRLCEYTHIYINIYFERHVTLRILCLFFVSFLFYAKLTS